MLKISSLVVITLGFFGMSYADDVSKAPFAPTALADKRMVMSYYEATGQLKEKIGLTYYADLKDHTFFSALLNGSGGHEGYYSYHRVSGTEGVITVEHPTGPMHGWTYTMDLHFSNPHLGIFDIVDRGIINGTMHGVFTLS